MSRRGTKPLWLAGLAIAGVLVAGALTWRELGRRSEVRRLHAASRREMAEMDAVTATLQARLGALARECDSLLSQSPTQPTAKAAAAPTPIAPAVPAAPQKPGPNALVQLEEQYRDPVMQALRLEAQRARMATRFAPLFRQLGLSAQQIAQFQDNVTRFDAQIADIQGATLAQGLRDDDDAVARLNGAAFEAHAAAQRALLGEAGFRAAQEFEHSLGVRDTVSGLAGTAVLEGVPFEAAQAERLVELLVRAGGREEGRWRGFEAIDWTVVDAEAATFLTPEQVRLLRSVTPQVPGGSSRFSTALSAVIERARAEDRKLSAGK